MMTSKSAGRVVAALLVAQMICGPIVNFVLLQPALAAPGFVETAAVHSHQIGLAVLISLATGVMTVGIATTTLPIFRRHSETMALWLLALAIVNLAIVAVENVGVMSMLSLSQAHAEANAAERGGLEAIAVVIASLRRWAHYLGLMAAGGVAFALYAALFRFALVPRVLAGLGIAASLLEIVAVAMPLFGYRIVFPLLAPLGLAHLALMAWLIAKGFAERPAPA